MRPNDDACWPALPHDAWKDTYDTLHLCSQVVGKVALAQAPPINHCWAVGKPGSECNLAGTITSLSGHCPKLHSDPGFLRFSRGASASSLSDAGRRCHLLPVFVHAKARRVPVLR